MYCEAREKLKGHSCIQLTDSLGGMEPNSFDIVVSLEVFEHLPEKELVEAIESIHRILSEEGILIVGVPNEIHLPALYKGVFRMARRYGAYLARSLQERFVLTKEISSPGRHIPKFAAPEIYFVLKKCAKTPIP